MANVMVLGAGMMGSALCVPLVDAGHEVRLVGTHLDEQIVLSLHQTGVHPKLNLALPDRIRAFPLKALGDAMAGVELIALGVSSAGVSWAARQIARFVQRDVPVVMLSKGLEWNGKALRVLPDVLSGELPEELRDTIHPIGIAGPCIAGELARRVETCVVFAGRDRVLLERAAELFAAPYYHVWTSPDVVGVEASAALKNAYAMGIAFAIGLYERQFIGSAEIADTPVPSSIAMHNYEAAVFAQAVHEMHRLVAFMGGEAQTVLGLAGVGDLDVTCSGGRTGRFGRLLGLGLGAFEATRRMQGATLECLDILRVMRDALLAFEATNELRAEQFPLLQHMASVALDGAEIDMPFSKFFGE